MADPVENSLVLTAARGEAPPDPEELEATVEDGELPARGRLALSSYKKQYLQNTGQNKYC